MSAPPCTPGGLARFQDDRFGMFVHWGLYSILARQEWVMHLEKIPVPEYEQLMTRFNPVKFDAAAWAGIAADAGQKYLVITSRHHDGFSMYDTKLSDYKVTRTPFKRDPLAELAQACRKRGVRLGFYSSLLDWHHPAYRFRTESGQAWSDYVGFLHGQVRELCTDFGPLAAIWFDGDWPRMGFGPDNEYFRPGGSFEYDALYSLIHRLQPDAVIHNNRHEEPLPGEDIQGFEQDLPGENTIGFNASRVYGQPLETCMTINDHWGWHAGDPNLKSVRRILHILLKCAAVGSNVLLNVGPTPEGEILPAHADRLRQVGTWLKPRAAGFYGTRAGSPLGDEAAPSALPHGVLTRHGDAWYLHALDHDSDVVRIKRAPPTLTRAARLADGAPVATRRDGADLLVVLPPALREDPVTTVVLS